MTYAEKLQDPRWKKLSLKIMKRDDYTCNLCGNTERTMNVHHIKYIGSNPWDTPPEYLVTVCDVCHEEITKYKIDLSTEALMLTDMWQPMNMSDGTIRQGKDYKLIGYWKKENKIEIHNKRIFTKKINRMRIRYC